VRSPVASKKEKKGREPYKPTPELKSFQEVVEEAASKGINPKALQYDLEKDKRDKGKKKY